MLPDDELIPRDRYDRPMIKQPDGTLVPYQRASTFCVQLSDHTGIYKWKLRHVVLGMGRYPDLQRLAAPLRYDPTAPTDENGRRMDDRDELDRIAERAMDRVGLNVKADYGTAVHSATEPDRDLDMLPDEQLRADAEAYKRALDEWGIEVITTEQFVVNDRWQCAGTLDHIYEVPGELIGESGKVRMVGDKKTGQLHLNEHALQLTVYATASLYDPWSGERTPLSEHGVDTRYGLVWHIPAGKAAAVPYLVDLREGVRAADLAAAVREWRKIKPGMRLSELAQKHKRDDDVISLLKSELGARELTAEERLEHAIRTAASETALLALWRTRRDIWTERHTELAAERKRELAS